MCEHGDNWPFHIPQSLVWTCDTKSEDDGILRFQTREDLLGHIRTAHTVPKTEEDIISNIGSIVACPLCYRSLQPHSRGISHGQTRGTLINDSTAPSATVAEIGEFLIRHIAEHMQQLALLTIRLAAIVAEHKDEAEVSSPVSDADTTTKKSGSTPKLAHNDADHFEDNFGIGGCMVQVACLFKDLSLLDKAKALEINLVNTTRMLYGPRHPNTLRSMERLEVMLQAPRGWQSSEFA